MENTEDMSLPIKKRRLALAFSPPKTKEIQQCPIPVFTSSSQKPDSINDTHFLDPRSPKRLCTENRNSESNSQKEAIEYLWGLFDFIRAEFLADSEEENHIGGFRPSPIEKKALLDEKKKKKKKPWWKSMVARGCDKLRREKMKLRKAKVKELFTQFWHREEEFQWKIEHKQDPFAILSLPVSTPYRRWPFLLSSSVE